MLTIHRNWSIRGSLVIACLSLLLGAQMIHPHPAFARSASCAGAIAVYSRYGSGYGSVTQTWSRSCDTDFAIATSSGLYILWTPLTGTHIVYGAIGNYYYTNAWPYNTNTCSIGFPETDEQDWIVGGFFNYGRENIFQYGTVYWYRASGAINVTRTGVCL